MEKVSRGIILKCNICKHEVTGKEEDEYMKCPKCNKAKMKFARWFCLWIG
jgi:rubrerythrin